LNESSLDYIGGMFMKNKNKFSSYAEALKRLELLKGQEQLQEATKYVLKQKPKTSEAPTQTSPTISDLPPAPPAPEPQPQPSPEDSTSTPDTTGSEPSDETSMGDDEMSGGKKRSDYMAEIQKFAGKLGQEIRDQKDRMESDDIKYVINMVISAVDLDKLDFEDLEDIREKFERDEENMGGDEYGVEDGEETSDTEKAPEPDGETPQDMG
jgi:hypothetical protein